MNIQDNLLTISEMTRSGQKLKNVKKIVLHFANKPNTTAMYNRNYFENLSKQKLTYNSCHYIVGLDGEIIKCVPEDEVTYHVSKIDLNFDTISIYCSYVVENQLGEKTYISLCNLLYDICSRYNLDASNDILRHFDIDGNRCPVYFVDNVIAFNTLKRHVKEMSLPKCEYCTGKYIINSARGLHTRKKPSINSGKVRSYLNNTVVPIFEINNEWGRTNGGWIPMRYTIPLENEYSKDYRITSVIGLNCREDPDINSNKVTTYLYNTIVTIYDVKDGWGKTKDGWVLMEYVVPIKMQGDYYIINATYGLNVRNAPDIESNITGMYKYNTIITVYEIANGWGRTENGWVSMEYLKIA